MGLGLMALIAVGGAALLALNRLSDVRANVPTGGSDSLAFGSNTTDAPLVPSETASEPTVPAADHALIFGRDGVRTPSGVIKLGDPEGAALKILTAVLGGTGKKWEGAGACLQSTTYEWREARLSVSQSEPKAVLEITVWEFADASTDLGLELGHPGSTIKSLYPEAETPESFFGFPTTRILLETPPGSALSVIVDHGFVKAIGLATDDCQ